MIEHLDGVPWLCCCSDDRVDVSNEFGWFVGDLYIDSRLLLNRSQVIGVDPSISMGIVEFSSGCGSIESLRGV